MQRPRKRFILVAGNIGVGKTTLTRKLGERLNWQTGYESVEDNPYLSDFYGDMGKWGFHLQVFFLGHRAEQHLALATSDRSAISDRSIYEDAYIFARSLNHSGNLSQRDFESYLSVYRRVVASLPVPDLLLYLKAPVPILLQRIRTRGREMEEGIGADYLTMLDRFYDDWMAEFDLCPVLTVSSTDFDFVEKPEHVEIVVRYIEDKLSSKDRVDL